MKTLINHLLTPVFYFFFGLWLVLFHPIQMVAYTLFGRKVHQKVVVVLNWLLVNSLRLLGTKISYTSVEALEIDRPKIFLANHSSLHDITGIYAYFGKYNPVFVSKLSLAKGIPSVSYNLRKSGAALINRKDRKQSISEIIRLGNFVNENKFAAVIFPEGTRRPGLQAFKIGGLNALLKKIPDALVVPIAIKGTADLSSNRKSYPLNTFQSISWNMLKPIDTEGKDNQTILDEVYEVIKRELDK